MKWRPVLASALILSAPDPVPAQDAPDTDLPGATAPAPPPLRGAAGGGTRINASARNVVTHSNGGTAITEIGSSTGRGVSSSTDARNVVTTSRGGETITRIGGGAGVVDADTIINEGGTLSIGANGISRDGMKCVEVYRNTCIIHFYYRGKHDPCLPGYWIDGRKCRLPSDRKHRIGG